MLNLGRLVLTPTTLPVQVEENQYIEILSSPSCDYVEVQLPNDLQLKGSSEQVLAAMKCLGYSLESIDTYYSKSSGKSVLISSMASPHIRAAILKILREYVDGLKANQMTNDHLLTVLDTIGSTTSVGMSKLVNELRKRGDD